LNFNNIISNFIKNFCLLFFFENSCLYAFIPERPIVVLVTSYNNKDWCERNVNSILIQDYSNYRVVYLDDCSLDGTADIVEGLVKKLRQESHFSLIRNQKRIGALANIYQTIHNYTKNEEIIVSLDGDDWFFDNHLHQDLQ
jgi:glycosyltransferase involved in cell wall biosynthesis